MASNLCRLCQHFRPQNCSPPTPSIESVCNWISAFLLYQTIDRKSWAKVTRDSRGAYSSLKAHLLHDIETPEGLPVADPLAESSDSYKNLKENEALRAEILQDVERCMQDMVFFQQKPVRETLLNILFVYCKINPDLGYRQGMHELLAPLVYVLHQDALDVKEGPLNDGDSAIEEVISIDYIENDAFSLFCIVMQTARMFYELGPVTKSMGLTTGESPIVERSRRLHEEYLRQTDPELASHLTAIDILPQIFLIRWMRLLFGREFPFDHVLALWDMIFAEDPALTLIDHICLAMLLRIRWQLLEADYSTALTLLLRYPAPTSMQQTAALVTDAVYLSGHMDLQGGSAIIRKYTQRAPLAALAQAGGEPVKRRGTHTPTSSVDLNKAFRPLRSPAEYLHNQGGLEAILQGAAKNVYSRSEQWGLNKAIRGAVQNFQQTSLSSPRQQAGSYREYSPSDSSKTSNSALVLTNEIKDLKNRNKQLSRMLGGAIDELLDQSNILEGKHDNKSATALTLTIAKLQYLQVHISDSQLPLDAEHTSDIRTTAGSTDVSELENRASSPTPRSKTAISKTHDHLISPNNGSGLLVDQLQTGLEETSTRESTKAKVSAEDPTTRTFGSSPQLRPSLASSSFSWMLEGEHDTQTIDLTSSSTSGSGRKREDQVKRKSAARSRAGFLFGDEDNDSARGH